MINNPIIRRELLTTLRAKRAIAMQGVFLLILTGLVWLLWPGGGLQDIGGEQARRLLGVIALGQLLLVATFAASCTAASMTIEKEQKTWECVFATPMKAWEIALGKMIGSLGFLILLVLSGIPALASVFLLGGVKATDILGVLGILFLTALYLGMIGLLISALMHRSYRAIIVTYVILLLVCFAVALPSWPVGQGFLSRGGPGLQKTLHVLGSFSPVQAMLSLVWPNTTYAQGVKGMPPFWIMFLPLSIAVIVLMAAACLWKLRNPPTPARGREKLKVVERGKISVRTFFFIIDPRKRKRMISWWKNPVLCKEFRTRPMLQTQWLLRAVGICLIVSVLLMFLVNFSVVTFMGESAWMYLKMASAVAVMMVVLIVMIGPAMSGGVISADRETGVWDLMRITPLSSWRIVSGKFQASIIPLLLLTIATLPALFILLHFKPGLLPNMLRICCVIGMTILFVSTAGMFFSAIFSRTSTATGWTYALVMSLALLSLFVLLAEDLFSRRLIASIFVLNPVVTAMEAAGHPSMQKYNLYANHLKIMGTVTAVMFLVTVVRVFQLRHAD